MSRPRRRMFGPLFYTTAAAAVFLLACAELDSCGPIVAEWLRERSLIRALQADDSRQRDAAVVALIKMGSTKIVPHLLEAAHDSRGEARALACRYLVSAGTRPEDLVPVLVAAAGDNDPAVRHEAALAFGRLVRAGAFTMAQITAPTRTTSTIAGDSRPAIITALRRLLKDRDGTTRVAAAAALELFGPDPETVADLGAATSDTERAVRLAVAQALLKVNGPNDPAASRTLVALVADPEPVADRRAVLDVVLSASIEVQDQVAFALAGLLDDIDVSIDGDVMECLTAMGPKARAAMPAIERLLDRADPVQRAGAAIALATVGARSTPNVIPNLLKVVGDLSVPVEWRQSALGKIIEIDEAKVVLATPILIEQLASKNVEVRENAVEMLRGIISERPAELPVPAGAK